MLTKAGEGYVKLGPVSQFPNCSSLNSGSHCPIEAKNFQGVTKYLPYTGGFNISTWGISGSALSTGFQGVAVGSGDSSESRDSYTLDNQITTITGTVTDTTTYDDTNNSIIRTLQYTINNTGSEAITIKEIGAFRSTVTSTTKGGAAVPGSWDCFMIDRTVLDTPVTIPAGESGIVRYQFVYNFDDAE